MPHNDPSLVGFPECYTTIDASSVTVVDVDSAGRPRALEVSGFTRGCPTVLVSIEGVDVQPVTVSGSEPNGAFTEWVPFTVVFPLNFEHEICGRTITIVATCEDNPECEYRYSIPVECEGCPQVEGLSAVPLRCENGSTLVRLRATISGFRPANTRVYWMFGDGPDSRSPDITLQHVNTDEQVEVNHAYASPGPYAARLEFSTRPGCAGGRVTVTELLDCDTDQPGCPTVTLSAEPEDSDVCDDRERRWMLLHARATQLPQPTTAKWYFPHDDSYSADFNLLLNEMVTRRKLFDVPGVYEARLQIEGCQTNSIQIDVTSPCRPQPGPQDTDCPAVEFTSIAEQGCSEPQRRRVRLIVNILEAPVPKNARLDFGDGSVPMDGYIVMGQSFEIEHFYAVGQIYTARLSIDGCPELSRTIDVAAPCPEPSRPPQLPGAPEIRPEPPECFWARIIGLSLLIIGVVLIWASLCLSSNPATLPLAVVAGVVGGILAVLGFGILVAWALLCVSAPGGCDVLEQTLKLLSLLAIIFGIVAGAFAVIAGLCALITVPTTGPLAIICLMPGACGVGAFADTAIIGTLLGILHAHLVR